MRAKETQTEGEGGVKCWGDQIAERAIVAEMEGERGEEEEEAGAGGGMG